jgi:hypothetical protein
MLATERGEGPVSEILTVRDVVALQAIVEAAQRTAKVARATDDGEITYGTARGIVGDAERLGSLRTGQDLRDAYLRVTTRGGWETVWSVRVLMREYHVGCFAAYDW